MKIKYLFLTLSAALIAGCSDDLERGGTYNPEKGVTATIPAYPFDDGTRVNISDDLQTFTWSDGDEIGIYYADTGLSADARFKILQGGSSTGNFSNDVFYLNNNKAYYSFYPYQPYGEINSVPVDYTGQTQSGNGSAAHLGAYNYMYGTVNINSTGGASIAYKNLGAVMQLQLTVSDAATYTGIDITSDGTKFITKGTASMINGSITATEISSSIHLGFQSGITLNAGDVLNANILLAPVDMSGSTLTIVLSDTDSNEFKVTIEGKKMLQGKAYLYAETVHTLPYVTFTANAEQTFQMSKAVSTLEYSVNGGEWVTLGTNTVTFGGEFGNLRLRGKSSVGTNEATISFGNATKVLCSGDIRTLVDYENHLTKETSKAQFIGLFKGCTSLTSAPQLPATELADSCYHQMFKDCTSLTKTPALPASSLASYCYSWMFDGCTTLTAVPELPAEILADNCYRSMFRGCTSLTEAPELPATTLAVRCYLGMFSDCTSLTQVPEELPATTLANYCYQSMFNGCTSLTQVPKLPATTLSEWCYAYMFYGCTSLKNAPELPATTLASYCYYSTFNGCTSLTEAPELPATTLAKSCYLLMFESCKSLINAPELLATTLAESCYASMFNYCTALVVAPELPATTLAESCYNQMFYGCISLIQAPELPATTLAESCYYHMFNGCQKMNYIKMMATDISASDCLNGWVNRVSTTGTFVKNKNATWDVTGSSGIPSGWSVVLE